MKLEELQDVAYEVDNGLAWVTINRPERFNSFRGKTIDELLLPDVPAGVPSQLLERRPDVRSAEQNLVAADARIDVARAQYFPTISLTGLFGYASDALSDLLQDSANVWSLGGTALGPIFTGGRISSQVRASEAGATETVFIPTNLRNALHSRSPAPIPARIVATAATESPVQSSGSAIAAARPRSMCRASPRTKMRDQTTSPGLLIPFTVPPPSRKYIGGCRSLVAPR